MVGVTRMELIASDKKRELTFQGRVKGMKKKAYELSTLCGLDIGMIICSPSGQIETLSWPNQQDDDGKTLLDLIASVRSLMLACEGHVDSSSVYQVVSELPSWQLAKQQRLSNRISYAASSDELELESLSVDMEPHGTWMKVLGITVLIPGE
ncbi:agamous-like MADS-box protein AGL82 [Tanacetum coccineum]